MTSSILNGFKDLFIPSSDYLSNNFDEFSSTFFSKFNIDTSALNDLKDISLLEPSFIYPVSLMGVSTNIDLSVLKEIVPYTRAIFTGITSIFAFIMVLRTVLGLVSNKEIKRVSRGGQ